MERRNCRNGECQHTGRHRHFHRQLQCPSSQRPPAWQRGPRWSTRWQSQVSEFDLGHEGAFLESGTAAGVEEGGTYVDDGDLSHGDCLLRCSCPCKLKMELFVWDWIARLEERKQTVRWETRDPYVWKVLHQDSLEGTMWLTGKSHLGIYLCFTNHDRSGSCSLTAVQRYTGHEGDTPSWKRYKEVGPIGFCRHLLLPSTHARNRTLPQLLSEMKRSHAVLP